MVTIGAFSSSDSGRVHSWYDFTTSNCSLQDSGMFSMVLSLHDSLPSQHK